MKITDPAPKEVANQIQWCYDMLAKNLSGSELATVRITLRESMKALESDEKRLAAIKEVIRVAKLIRFGPPMLSIPRLEKAVRKLDDPQPEAQVTFKETQNQKDR